MAGVINKDTRQYNLKCVKNGVRYVCRVAPGFNVFEDEHWKPFIDDPYTKSLKEKGVLDFGAKVDDLELEQAPDTKSKSKADKMPEPIGSSKGKGKSK